jgi:hypothetical protein
MLAQAIAGELGELHFLDLRADVVERELTRSGIGGARDGDGARPGPHAEAILRELGIVAAGPV